MIYPLIAPGVTGISGWYDNRLEVPGTRDYILEHSSIYIREYRVSTGYQSATCLLRTGITYEYTFIFSYLAPGALLLLLCAFIYLSLMIFVLVVYTIRVIGTKLPCTRCMLHFDQFVPRIYNYTPPLLLLLWRKWSKKVGSKANKKARKRPQESWDIAAPCTRTNPPKKVLICCAFGRRTWDVVVFVVVRIYLFGVDDVLYLLLLFTLYE